MRISVSEAKGRLTDLVRRAEAGEDVVLMRHGQPTVRLTPVRTLPDMVIRRRILDELRGSAKAEGAASAARSQDFLYDKDGLPG